MGRILGLDLGSKTIGVALSDETQTLAFPGVTILRQPSLKGDLSAVRDIVQTKEVREIVIGLPLMMDGSRGVQTEKVDAFVASLRNYIRIPISFQDERLTTSEAERVLINADRRRDQRKQVVDSMAACLILQTFLDRRKTERRAEGVNGYEDDCDYEDDDDYEDGREREDDGDGDYEGDRTYFSEAISDSNYNRKGDYVGGNREERVSE